MNRTRRSLLAAGAGTVAALAGCLGGSDDPGGSGGAATGTYELPDHAATAGIEDQPVLGELSRPGVIVGFEDPSCPRCKRFETSTLPKIRSNLVESGKAAFVWRSYPVVYEWGKPATKALEATLARDEGAFWSLLGHFFEEQSSFDTGNVYDRAETFLADETGVDGAAVVEAARGGDADAAVQTDLDAGKNAGAGGSTPKFYLFRDGAFQTQVSGPQDYTVFETALGF